MTSTSFTKFNFTKFKLSIIFVCFPELRAHFQVLLLLVSGSVFLSPLGTPKKGVSIAGGQALKYLLPFLRFSFFRGFWKLSGAPSFQSLF